MISWKANQGGYHISGDFINGLNFIIKQIKQNNCVGRVLRRNERKECSCYTDVRKHGILENMMQFLFQHLHVVPDIMS